MHQQVAVELHEAGAIEGLTRDEHGMGVVQRGVLLVEHRSYGGGGAPLVDPAHPPMSIRISSSCLAINGKYGFEMAVVPNPVVVMIETTVNRLVRIFSSNVDQEK